MALKLERSNNVIEGTEPPPEEAPSSRGSGGSGTEPASGGDNGVVRSSHHRASWEGCSVKKSQLASRLGRQRLKNSWDASAGSRLGLPSTVIAYSVSIPAIMSTHSCSAVCCLEGQEGHYVGFQLTAAHALPLPWNHLAAGWIEAPT